MLNITEFFHLGPSPPSMIDGSYNPGLVILSYLIAFFASYIALDFAGRLEIESNNKTKWYWLLGGAFSMGAGIWSMHFIGMLAFIMPMPMTYESFWTFSSFIVAIISAGFALFLVRNATYTIPYLAAGGVVLGLGIATMHYMGMAGMVGMKVRYLPYLFFLSIIIAIVASEAALWFALKSNQGSFAKQVPLKILSALIMGGAICGMHYTGMAAAIFTPLHFQHPIERIDPFTLSIYIAGVTGIILTIALMVSTYKQLMESSIQNDKNFLYAVLNNLSDGVLACDEKGHVTVANPAFRSLINIGSNEQLSGKLDEFLSLYKLNNTEPMPYSELPIIRALNGEKIEEMELELRGENNRHVIVSGQPIMNVNAERLGAVIAIHDITENKKAKELEDVNKELEAFASITSHDLRAPLRAIERLTSWIEEDSYTDLSEESKDHFDLLKKRVQRMNTLIEGILHYSRVGRKNIEPSFVNIKELLDDIVLGLWVPAGFDIQIGTDMPSLVTPEILLRQVFSNLITNAIKHHKGKEGKIRITSLKSGEMYQFCVQDNGPGIPKEYQEKIFDIYQTLNSDSEKESAGIGLAIVKKAISRVNGKIWIKSQEGKGAKFYFTWPVTYKI